MSAFWNLLFERPIPIPVIARTLPKRKVAENAANALSTPCLSGGWGGEIIHLKKSATRHTAFQAGVCDISLNRARKKPQEAARSRERPREVARSREKPREATRSRFSRSLAVSRGFSRPLAASGGFSRPPPMFNEMRPGPLCLQFKLRAYRTRSECHTFLMWGETI